MKTKSLHYDKRVAAEVGARLRAVRIRNRQTLRQVASEADLSESYLSQVERGLANAGLGAVQRVVSALGITLADLFTSVEDGGTGIIRKAERPSLDYGVLGRKFRLTPAGAKGFDVFIGEFEVGGSTGADAYAHGDVEEVLVVLTGTYDVEVGGITYVLHEGDSMSYRSSVPHRVANRGDADASIMWIVGIEEVNVTRVVQKHPKATEKGSK